VYRIYDDYDFIDVVQIDSLINIVFDGKELSFSSCNIDGMMDCLDDWTVMNIDICYQSSNLVLDTYV